MWNLNDQLSATWEVSDIHGDKVRVSRFELAEAFAVAHEQAPRLCGVTVYRGNGFAVEAHVMDHRTPSLAYVVREDARKNVEGSGIVELGLRPGRWIERIKDDSDPSEFIEIDGADYSVAELREKLIIESPGESLAYLTDFLLDDSAMCGLVDALAGCNVMVCEGQYRHSDIELARGNYHMTTVLSAKLAREAKVDQLILFHLSDRYDRSVWAEMLREAKEIFPATQYPAEWGLGLNA
jgi:ribonuclease Z